MDCLVTSHFYRIFSYTYIIYSHFLSKCFFFGSFLFVRSFCHCCHDTFSIRATNTNTNMNTKKSGWRRCFWHWMFIVAFDFIWLFLLDVSKYHKPLLLLRGHHINDQTHSVELEMCFKCEWLMKNFFYIIHTYTHSLNHCVFQPISNDWNVLGFFVSHFKLFPSKKVNKEFCFVIVTIEQ